MVDDYFCADCCFDALTSEQRDDLEKSKISLDFKQGEVIIKQGFSASHILFLEKGFAKLDVENDGHTNTIKILSSQSFIGLMCSFVKKKIDFSAVALLPSKVSLFDRDLFESFILNNGEFAVKVVKLMSSLTNELVHDMTRIRKKNIEGVMASFLLDWSDLFESKEYQLPLTRVEIAGIVGYSKESVINTLSSFHKEKLISLSGKQVKILEPKRLRKIVEHS